MYKMPFAILVTVLMSVLLILVVQRKKIIISYVKPIFLLSYLVSRLRFFEIHRYWKNLGVRYVRPWPFLGYMAPHVLRLRSFSHVMQDLYNTFPEQRYFGCFLFLMPNLLIRDPKLVKKILVKDFDTFPQHRPLIEANADPLGSKNLFALSGEQWRDMRSTLSPVFTSSKMRGMFTLMKECAEQFVAHFKENGDTVEIDIRDPATRFANDVIASTAFGITCNSLKNPTNEFYLMAKEITTFSVSKMLKFFGYSISPRLMKLFRFRLFGEAATSFFRGIVAETIRVREEEGLQRPDMIQLLMEARKGRLSYDDQSLPDSSFAVVQESMNGLTHNRKLTEITYDDITAQAVLFLFAGVETSSIALSHLTYELALNQKIQARLRKEIDKTRKECADDITYEALLRMRYMDMVVSESLRKWPPVVVNDRTSVKPFTIEAERAWEKTVTVEVGTTCLFPVFAIHRDPKNYPGPDKFDPERFSDANKGNISTGTYLPYGAGPRSCIASRFALMGMKTFIFYLLSAFEVIPTNKTKNPLVLSKRIFHPVPDYGFWVGLKPRCSKLV